MQFRASGWAIALAAVVMAGATETCAAEPTLVASARAALDRSIAAMASIATEGGWVWRYSLDLEERAGESKATPTMIWVQPPGTPSVGMAILRAHAVTGDPRHLDAALAAADALATGQLASGGWDYSIDFDPTRVERVLRRTDLDSITPQDAARRFNVSTFDDDTTQAAIRFLLTAVDACAGADGPRERRIRAACDHALAKLLEAQLPCGAWPQRYDGNPRGPAEPPRRATIPADWPREWPKDRYERLATLNDDVQLDCIETLREAHRRRGDPAFMVAIRRAGDFLVAAQLPEPQPGWAQQYDERMHPAWARAFEPPAVATRETAGAIRALVAVCEATGDRRYLEPIPAAIAWLERSRIGPDRWPRFLELGTNRPIYGDRDGRIHFSLDEISEERRTGYGWEGSFGVPAALKAYRKASEREADEQGSPAEEAPSPESRAAQARSLEPRVREVIAALDDEGRWVTRGRFTKESNGLEFGDRIETATFIANLDLLATYIQMAR
jgi:hypothetical protein